MAVSTPHPQRIGGRQASSSKVTMRLLQRLAQQRLRLIVLAPTRQQQAEVADRARGIQVAVA